MSTVRQSKRRQGARVAPSEGMTGVAGHPELSVRRSQGDAGSAGAHRLRGPSATCFVGEIGFGEYEEC